MGGLEQPGNSISQSQGLEPKIHACRDTGCMHNTHGTSVLGFWSPLDQAPRLEGLSACQRPEGALQQGGPWAKAPGHEAEDKPAGERGYQGEWTTASSRQSSGLRKYQRVVQEPVQQQELPEIRVRNAGSCVQPRPVSTVFGSWPASRGESQRKEEKLVLFSQPLPSLLPRRLSPGPRGHGTE